MSKLEEKKQELKAKREEFEKVWKEIGELALKELEQAKKDGKSFDEIFELWLREETPKKDYGLIHISVKGDGRDIWDYIGYGEPIRSKRYEIYDIVQYLEDAEELTKDQLKEFKRQLMEQNVGSTVFDW